MRERQGEGGGGGGKESSDTAYCVQWRVQGKKPFAQVQYFGTGMPQSFHSRGCAEKDAKGGGSDRENHQLSERRNSRVHLRLCLRSPFLCCVPCVVCDIR